MAAKDVKTDFINNLIFEAWERGHRDIVKLLQNAAPDIQESTALDWAVFQGHTKIVRMLLKAGPNIAQSKALTEASRLGYTEIVRMLLDAGPNITERRALTEASIRGYTEIVGMLLDAGPNITESKDLDGAVFQGRTKIVRMLLKAGPNIAQSKALTEASRLGYTEIVRMLLDAGPNITESRALTEASIRGYTEIVGMLLDAGPNITESLDWAASRGHTETVRMLLKAGPNIPQSKALTEVSKRGNTEIVGMLLDAGPNITESKALLKASSRGYTDIVRMLLDAGQNVTESKALLEASSRGYTDIVRILFDAGQNITESDALLFAVSNGHKETVQLLLSVGRDIKESEALNTASEAGHNEVVKTLLNAARTINDSKALTVASKAGHNEVVKTLLNATETIKDTEALSAACLCGHAETVDILLSAGEKVKDSKALSAASRYGHVTTIKLLLDWKENIPDNWSIVKASSEGQTEKVKILLKRKSLPGETDISICAFISDHQRILKFLSSNESDIPAGQSEALLEAVWNGHLPIVKLLLKDGTTLRNTLALEAASRKGHAKIVKILLHKPDYKDTKALMSAAGNGHIKTVEILLDNRYYRDNDELIEAARVGNNNLVREIVSYGWQGKSFTQEILQGATNPLWCLMGPIQRNRRRNSYFRKTPSLVAIYDMHGIQPANAILEPPRELIPSSILEMDKETIKKYVNDLDETAEESQNIKIVFSGKEGSGKTTLAKQLVGENLQALRSTNLADFYLRRLLIDLITMARFTGHSANQVVVERMRMLLEKKSRTASQVEALQSMGSGVGARPKTKSRLGRIMSLLPKKIKPKKQKSSEAHGEEARQSRNSDVGARPKIKDQGTTSDVTRKIKPAEESPQETSKDIEDIKLQTAATDREFSEDDKNTMSSILQSPADTLYESKAFVSLYDFGGEEVFFNAHHSLLSSDTIFILVFNVLLCLQDDDEGAVDRIIFWLRLIATYPVSEEERERGTPPVLLVGTHLDLVDGTEEEKQAKSESVIRRLKEIPEIKRIMDRHVKGVFYIANLDDSKRERDVFQDIWRSVVDIAPLQSQWHRLVPGRWLFLEHELLGKKENGMKVMVRSELLETSERLPLPIPDLDDLKHFLRYVHRSGLMLCFDIESDDLILVLDIQWVIDAFKSLITTSKFAKESEGHCDQQWADYEISGKLPAAFLRMLLSQDPEKSFVDHLETLVLIMEKLNLIVKPLPKDEDDEVVYFIVPSMLKMTGADEIQGLLKSVSTFNTCPLILKFDNHFLPPAVWDKLIAACIHRFQPCEISGQERYSMFGRQSAAFAVDCLWTLLIQCKDNSMKLTLFRKNNEHTDLETDGDSIRKVLEKILQQVLEMNQQGHLQFQYYLQVNQDYIPVKAGILPQPSPPFDYVVTAGQGQMVTICKDVYEVWFRNEQKSVHKSHQGVTRNERPTYREIGRMAKYIYKAFHMCFIELDLEDREISQVRDWCHDEPYRTMITKLLITWMNPHPRPTIDQIVSAMKTVGLDTTCMLKEIDRMQEKVPLDGVSLSQTYLQRQPGQEEIDTIASKHIGSSYYSFFLELNLSPIDIEKAHLSDGKITDVFKSLLHTWIRKFGQTATLEQLLMAMRECRMPVYKLVQNLMEYDT